MKMVTVLSDRDFDLLFEHCQEAQDTASHEANTTNDVKSEDKYLSTHVSFPSSPQIRRPRHE